MICNCIYEFQKNELKAEIIRKGYSIAEVAKAVGIDVASLHRKMSGKSDFYRSEIQKIREILNLSEQDLLRIFFAHKVA